MSDFFKNVQKLKGGVGMGLGTLCPPTVILRTSKAIPADLMEASPRSPSDAPCLRIIPILPLATYTSF